MAKQKNVTRIGLWLDHSVAHFIDFNKGRVVIESIESSIESHVHTKSEKGNVTKLSKIRSNNNEKVKYDRHQNQSRDYYKVISKMIKPYDWVYIFGPTTAKNELINYIRSKEKLKNKTYIIGSAEEMTVNQMVAKAKEVLAGS